MSLLEAALAYVAQGWHVFPLSPGTKIPPRGSKGHLAATRDVQLIQQWWGSSPDFNIGIATGEISGITVLDVDGKEGMASSKTITGIPKTRMVKTPKGYHLYFQYNPGFHTGAGFMEGLDVRNGTIGGQDGGYVVAPPSVVDGITYIVHRDLPLAALEVVPEIFMRQHRNGATAEGEEKPQWIALALEHGADQGTRDETARDLIWHFKKTGMAPDIMRPIMLDFAAKCRPPFSERDILSKIQRVQQEYLSDTKGDTKVTGDGVVTGRVTLLADQVDEWLRDSGGAWFFAPEIHRDLGLTSMQDKNAVKAKLSRMAKQGHVERHQTVNGKYRHVVVYVEGLKFKTSVRGAVLDLHWPLGVEEYVHLYPGNVAVLAGNSNAGKTAFCLSFIWLNHEKNMPIYYFCSEMEEAELGDRLAEFGAVSLDEWNFDAFDRQVDFDQVVVKDAINIIDYLDLDDNWYMIKAHFEKIRRAIGNGFALVAMQKKGNLELGYGQDRSLATPKLYLSMSAGKLTIVKGKVPAKRGVSANGLYREFQIQDGAFFLPMPHDQGWRYREEKGA